MTATGYLDACGFVASSSGTGNFVVSSAVTGRQTPASAGAVNGTVYSYRAQSSDLTQWEEGYGAYTVSTTTLARTTITANSSGGTSAINFSAAPNVYITALSADLQNAALLTSNTVSPARLGSGSPGSGNFLRGDSSWQNGLICRAAVKWTWNGTSITVLNSFNVTSVVRASAGNYTITFTNAFADANYYASAMAEARGGTNVFFEGGASPTSSIYYLIGIIATGSAVADPSAAHAMFFE